MKVSDIESHGTDRLDKILVDLCQMVIAGQKSNPHYWGMVAAAVLDHRNNIVMSCSYFNKEQWIHAERAALDLYYEKFGEKPTRRSTFITTLSPCNVDTMSDRYGQSCTDLINESGVKQVYTGYQDPTQDNPHRKFNLEVTDNPKIQKLCKALAGTFLETQP